MFEFFYFVEPTNSNSNASRASFVWHYMLKQEQPNSDHNLFKVNCKLCGASYNWKKGSGTGTLSRHLGKHNITKESHANSSGTGQVQTQLGGYMTQNPGGGTPFHYNRDDMIDHMARFVCLDEHAFSFGDSINYEEFNRLSLQPAYRRVPRNTLKDRMMRQYYEARGELFTLLDKFDGHVCLTSDTWSSRQGEAYLCITAHWIDSQFFLQKRIIAFDVMDEKHTGYNIYTRILATCKEFSIHKKLFTISFDNATANTKAIETLKKDGEVPLMLNGVFLHVRCCAHIVNLSAQDGIQFIEPLLKPIRKVVKWIRSTGVSRREYKRLCQEEGLKCRKFCLDTPTRWNSTYTMLKQAIVYKKVISIMYNESQEDENEMISEEHWNVGISICELLKAYKNATTVFSYVYIPNVHNVIMQCYDVVSCFVDCEEKVPSLQTMVNYMRKKWCDYFVEFPYIYGIACILDPGVKDDGLINMLDAYYECLHINYDVNGYVNICKDLLSQLIDIYAKNNGIDLDSSSNVNKPSRFPTKIARIIGKKQKTSSKNATELVNEYLNYSFETNHMDFDILQWWRSRESTFPILTKIARDVLVVPASTIASESAFSAGGRILTDRRSSLAPESVKVCVCKRDWDLAAKRQQQRMWKDEEDNDPNDPFMILTCSGSNSDQDAPSSSSIRQ